MTSPHPSYRGAWVRPPLESSLPHQIVRPSGATVTDYGQTVYTNRGTATRRLNEMIKAYDKRRRGWADDPRNWAVRPVKEAP